MKIEIDGIKFYKGKTGYYFNGSSLYLHRYIWTKHNGKIEKGFHVHHVDGDKNNNDISNLALISATDHTAQHYSESVGNKMKRWHASKEGRLWHKERADNFFKRRQEVTKICKHCKKEYKTKGTYSFFCNNKCMQLFHYHKNKSKR